MEVIQPLIDLLNEPGVVPFLTMVFGGVFLKLVEYLMGGKKKLRHDIAASIREELRQDKKSLREELNSYAGRIKELEESVFSWREKYYELQEKYYATVADLKVMQDLLRKHGIDAPQGVIPSLVEEIDKKDKE